MSDSMMEKRIAVPEGMLKAVLETFSDDVETCLLKALRWLRDNPIVPTRQNLEDMRTDWEDTPEQNAEKVVLFLISEWQRRMFLAPEVPEEIKDLWNSSPTPDTKRRVVEAYRRGRAK